MLSNNCSILLIDDDADVLDAYTQLLEQAGYHVSACNNPFDAREQVPKDWPGINCRTAEAAMTCNRHEINKIGNISSAYLHTE